jgi:carbon storage regulator
MLVLSRRVGETICLGGGIQVTVVAVRGASVRLGILAPQATVVDRLEVHNLRAAQRAAKLPPESN